MCLRSVLRVWQRALGQPGDAMPVRRLTEPEAPEKSVRYQGLALTALNDEVLLQIQRLGYEP